MAHETPTITAQKRDRTGTRYAQRLRSSGRLPAIIYGHQTDPLPISVDEKETVALLHHGAHVMNVNIEGGSPETCLVKDLQFGYLGDNVIHIDFARVNMDEEVTVNVHIRFTGEPEAIKQPGAILRHDITELEIVCKVKDIPEEIVVDQSDMESTITVEEVKLPEGVRCELEPETLVAHIGFVAEVEEGEEAEVDTELEPELISEADEEEGEEGEAEAVAEEDKTEE